MLEPSADTRSGGRRRYVIELRELGLSEAQTGAEAVTAVVSSLEPELRREKLGELSVGKMATTAASTECTVYVGLDATNGSSVAVRALPGGGPNVWLVVAPSSKMLRYGVWVILAVVGLATTVVLDVSFPTLPRILHLLGGLIGGGLAAVAVQHTSALAGERAHKLTDEVNAVVAWRKGLGRAPATEKERKTRKRKKRREPREEAP